MERRISQKRTTIIPDAQNNVDNDALIEKYLADAKCMGLTRKTIDNYRSCLKVFSEYMVKPLIDVDISDLRNFKIHIECKKNRYGEVFAPSTISRYFSAIQSFFEYLEFEDYVDKSTMPKFRKRYLREYKRKRYSDDGSSRRKLISVEEMSMMINSIMDPRDKAVLTVLAKTGVRREELSKIDVDNVDWMDQCIRLKPTRKRTNLDVFFDDECARMLRRWMISRENWKNNGTKALFLNERGGRLGRNAIYEMVVKHATKVGLHNPKSHRISERFTTHCGRHFNSTHLLRNGMPREMVKELRGDSRHEAIDIYHHIDRKELKDTYLACIPQFGLD